MMGLLQGFTEGGLLKDVNDLKSFKEKMVDLTKNVKAGALILNETFDSITDLLAEMKKAGISQKNYSYLLSSGKVLGAELGKDGSEVVRNLIGTASGLTQGTGYNTEDQLNRLQNTTLYVNSMYENLSHQNFDSLSSKQQAVINMVKNLGGP
jgi:prophage DNA circulation protein